MAEDEEAGMLGEPGKAASGVGKLREGSESLESSEEELLLLLLGSGRLMLGRLPLGCAGLEDSSDDEGEEPPEEPPRLALGWGELEESSEDEEPPPRKGFRKSGMLPRAPPLEGLDELED